jgi:hypothetical protein
VPVLLAALLASSPVPLFAARMRILTTMPPGHALNLKPCPYLTGLQVHIRPAETESFTLPDAQSECDRAASVEMVYEMATSRSISI